MKKIKYLGFGLLAGFIFLATAEAASFGVSTNARTVVVGNTFNVTVTVNGTGTKDGAAGAWTYCVSYDSSILTLTSPSSPCVLDGLVGFTGASQTFTFKAKKSGSATISLNNAVAYDYGSTEQMNTTKGSVTITAKTQSEIIASYSTNDNLSGLKVDGYDIDPVFNKNTLEYSLEVPNDVEKVNVIASKEDTAARISGAGEKELTEGLNKIEIVVTAEKGNQKTYVLNITRKELNPINVTVDSNSYTVIRKADMLEAPPYYTSATAIISDEEVPAFKSEISGYTLVGLKNENGESGLYIYDTDNGEYRKYQQLGLDGFVLVVEKPESLVDGYDKEKVIKVSDIEVTTYYKDGNDENFVLVYGMNAGTGEKNWYQYDILEGTFQRFQNNEVIKLKEDLKDYMLMMIIFASGFGLSLLSIIALLITVSKTKKKNIRLMAVLENGKVVSKDYTIEEVQNDDEDEEEEEIPPEPIKKRRGRKKKIDTSIE